MHNNSQKHKELLNSPAYKIRDKKRKQSCEYKLSMRDYYDRYQKSSRAAKRLGIPRVLYASLKIIDQFDKTTESHPS